MNLGLENVPPGVRLRAVISALAIFCAAASSSATTREFVEARIDRETGNVTVRASGLDGARYELEIETPGLREIETGRDVNEPGIIYLPPARGPVRLTDTPQIPADAENVFFFHTLDAAPGWDLIACFSPQVTGTWKLNGRFSPHGGPISREISVPADQLELGENLLHLRMPRTETPRLVYRCAFTGGKFSARLRALRPDWRGKVTLYRTTEVSRREVATDEIAGAKLSSAPREVPAEWWRDRAEVAARVRAVANHILRAQIDRPGSLFDGGFHLAYDVRLETPRISHWLWSWGPAIAFLLELERHDPTRDPAQKARWRAAALRAAKRSLEFGVTDSLHPAGGVSTVRWEPSRATPQGWAEYVSTADSLFLAGWGWMSAHRETGESVFLERTQQLVSAAERLMNQYPVVPQDWVVERARWTPHTLDESVFGLIGFRELHAATKASAVAKAGRRFLDSHLRHMSRGSGLLERAWLREEDKAIWDPDIKGHAWVVEGYLDAYRLSGDKRYFELARHLADQVVACQGDDGAWTYLFRKPGANDPRDDKGTAIWAFFFYDVFRATQDEKYLNAARRAMAWCLRHQHFGDDPDLAGAVVHENGMAYVRRRPITILYTNTFFGLALLEELSLAEKRQR